jgi:uncharacterized delta-60 repeat protein
LAIGGRDCSGLKIFVFFIRYFRLWVVVQNQGEGYKDVRTFVFTQLPAIFLITLFLIPINLFAAPGAVSVDPTFAPVLQDFGATFNRAVARVSALQPDGKILAGGNFTVASGLPRSGVARFNADGTPDPSFDAGNIGVAERLLTNSTGGAIYAITLQPDGKILIGGIYRRGDETTGRCIERLNADGSVDTTFQPAITGDFASVGDMEVQADGKVVVGGSFDITATNPANGQQVRFQNLARLNTDGSFDFSFVTNAPNNITKIALQADGKIVAGNASTSADPNVVIRFNTNGSTDKILANLDDWVSGLEVLPDGKIVVTGHFVFVDGVFQKFIMRLNPDGGRDTSFASNVQFVNGLSFEDVEVQADGKYIVCGEFHVIDSYTRWRVARFNTDGSMDTTFNTSTPIAGVVGDVLALPDGKVFIGGAFPLEDGNTFYNNIGRMNADGSIDTNFNHANVIMEGEGYSIIEQPDGKVVVGGFMYYANNARRRGIARFNADGTLDTGFVPYPNLSSGTDIALQADGKIMIVNSDSPSTLFRLNTDGSLDASFTSPFVSFSASIQKRTRITQIVIQPDGKILVAGAFTKLGNQPRIGAARLIESEAARTPFDFDGDGRADISIYRPSDATWYLMRSRDGFSGIRFGLSTDRITPADYDGDGKTDIAVYRPSDATWYILRSRDGFTAANFGIAEDIPQPADYNGDGKAEIGVFRPSEGNWYTLDLTNGQFTGLHFGAAEDKPVAGDYDGDGKADYAVYRPSEGTWYILGSTSGFAGIRFGIAADRPVPADYDGDGKTDAAVYRDGDWHLNRSRDGYMGFHWGLAGDQPVPADYDGDGKADPAVFRDGTWYLQGTTGGFTAMQFGMSGDRAVPNGFVH